MEYEGSQIVSENDSSREKSEQPNLLSQEIYEASEEQQKEYRDQYNSQNNP